LAAPDVAVQATIDINGISIRCCRLESLRACPVRVIPMHLLRLLFMAWLELGIVTVFVLYRLCKRTARRINTFGKPVLDQHTFQQLLAAAYTLQEQNRHPVTEIKTSYPRTVSMALESAPMAQSDFQTLPSLNDSPVSSAPDRRTPRSDEFFWRIATAVATAGLLALLFVTLLHRPLPLPAGLELVQQDAPFRKNMPQNSGAAAKAIMMQPQATRIENSVVVDKPGRSAAASAHKTIVNPIRHSIYESEADIVAPDTVMRYGRRPSVAP